MDNAIDNLRHLIDCYGWRDSRDMQDFIDAADMIDRQYVELPRDADGEHIHVGNDMESVNAAHMHGPVEYIALTESGWEVDGDQPKSLRHHATDTWERIIEDALDGYHDTDFDALVARCKALAGDAK